MKNLTALLVLGLLVLLVSSRGNGEPRKLVVAVSNDIPPYVSDGAQRGLEIDLLKRILADYQVAFIQMDELSLESAVQSGQADVAVGVQDRSQGVYYSRPFITFVNAAISKKADLLKINSVQDLAGYPVYAWPDAWRELSPQFAAQYAPQAPQRQYYREFPRQVQQVRAFWETDNAVIVIDVAIFDAVSRQQARDIAEATRHDLFPPVTRFRVAFAGESVRDDFDDGMAGLCDSGDYLAILSRYALDPSISPCEN